MSFLDEALEIEPENFETRLLRGTVLAEVPKLDESANELKKSLAIHRHLETSSMLGYVYALKGERDLALSYLESMSQFHENHFFPMTYRARIWFALGDTDRGFGYLEEAFTKREAELVGAWDRSPVETCQELS